MKSIFCMETSNFKWLGSRDMSQQMAYLKRETKQSNIITKPMYELWNYSYYGTYMVDTKLKL